MMKRSFTFFTPLLFALLLLGLSNSLFAQGYSGGAGTAGNPYQIATLDDLRYLSEHSADWVSGKYYIQTAYIDATATSGWNGSAGFSPIGNSGSHYFSANYNGQNHIISNLTINRPLETGIGLFGYLWGPISNLRLVNATIHGFYYVGAMVGYSNATVSNCHSSGSVASMYYGAGGLVGTMHGSVMNCSSSCNISNSYDFGTGG